MKPLICLISERIVAPRIKTLCRRINHSMLESLGRLRTTFTTLSTVAGITYNCIYYHRVSFGTHFNSIGEQV